MHTHRAEQFAYCHCGDRPLINKRSVNFVTAVADVGQTQLDTCIK